MSTSPNFFITIFVLLCVFSVIVRDFLSASTLFWSLIGGSVVILTIFFLKSEIFLLFFAFFALIFRPVTIFARKRREKIAFRAALRPFITRLILDLKTGKSLRSSLRGEKFGSELFKMLEKQKNWSLNDARWDEFAKILLNLDRDPARIVPQLENFRFGLQVEERFKARVQQILSQPRLQAVIAILLYAGLCIFTVQSFEVEDFRLFMIISAIFVASGTFCLIKLGSRYQWKV